MAPVKENGVNGNGSHYEHAYPRVLDIAAVLNELTLDDKMELLAGSDFWHFGQSESKVTPKLRLSDGPNGIRGTRMFGGQAANCYPCGTALAASFNKELLLEVGTSLGLECRAKGVHLWLAPTVNIPRTPLGGRGFECLSEDPVLSGYLASELIKGCQGTGVTACPKHYVANECETDRNSNNSEVSMRALREVYLKPFQILIRESAPRSLMASYNRVNGIHVSEDPFLLKAVLRQEWGFKGMVMSDWYGTYSTTEAIKATLDLEMPGTSIFRGRALRRALVSKKLTEEDMVNCITKILTVSNYAIASGIPFDEEEQVFDTPASRSLLYRSALESMVLLRNRSENLPLKQGKIRKIAIIGPTAKAPVACGGGSANLRLHYYVTPFEGISNMARSQRCEVSYAMGCQDYRYLPLLDSRVCGTVEQPSLYKLDFYDKNPKDPASRPVHTMNLDSSNAFMCDNIPFDIVPWKCWACLTTTFIPDATGDWEFGLVVGGQGDLYVDDELLIDNTTVQTPGDLFFGGGSVEERARLYMEEGRNYRVRLEFSNFKRVDPKVSFHTFGAFRIGAHRMQSPETMLQEAVRVAEEADAVILLAGLGEQYESEGFDRKHLKLPSVTDKLIESVCAANSNTCVVVQSGMPVEMPWTKNAASIIQAFYAGSETGNALAAILFGEHNPSARLPVTFPRRLEDHPSHPFGPGTEGRTYYRDDVFVGYRGLVRALDNGSHSSDDRVLGWFGEGLSYTTFNMVDAEVQKISIVPESSQISVEIVVRVENTGRMAGAEVVQCYVAPPPTCSVPRPARELADFAKVFLQPGESKFVTMRLKREAFSYWSSPDLSTGRQDVGSWIVHPGTYTVQIGRSCVDIVAEVPITVDDRMLWVGL